MITEEMIVRINDYRIKFSLFNNENKFVTIHNDEQEFGASGNFCTSWDEALASAFVEITEMMFVSDAVELLNELKTSENIDNNFLKYLPEEWQDSSPWINEKAFDAMYTAWESTWIDGPQW